jgi:hypothetical protein
MSRFAALLAIILNAFVVAAQTLPKTVSKLPSRMPAPSLPFDARTNDVPPRFSGNNAESVYEAAKKNLTNSSQSEFESKAEYLTRTEGLSNKPFWGNMKAKDQFAFVLGNDAAPVSTSDESEAWLYGYIGTKYDAESKQMTIKIPLEATPPDADGKYYRWVSLWHRVHTHLGSFVGENGFGARRTVNRLGLKDTDLVIDGSEWLDFDCTHESDSESCSFETDAQQARTFSRDVRVIAVGTLVAPLVSSESYVSQPSTENPTEIHHSYRFLHMQLDQLLIVNNQTGHVIKNYSREKHAAEYAVNVEFRLRKDGEFPDERCKRYAFLFRNIDVNYSIDGDEYKSGVMGLKLSARHFVDVKITYCNVSRVEVLLNGQPYDLQCEGQAQFIANPSKCSRIQLVP